MCLSFQNKGTKTFQVKSWPFEAASKIHIDHSRYRISFRVLPECLDFNNIFQFYQ